MGDNVIGLPGVVLPVRSTEPVDPEREAFIKSVTESAAEMVRLAEAGLLQNYLLVGLVTEQRHISMWSHNGHHPATMMGTIDLLKHDYKKRILKS